jgi:hypothetical protein
VLDTENPSERVIVMNCDMETSLRNATKKHVHMIRHELSDDSKQLKTTYTIYSDGKYKKDTIYHFQREDWQACPVMLFNRKTAFRGRFPLS